MNVVFDVRVYFLLNVTFHFCGEIKMSTRVPEGKSFLFQNAVFIFNGDLFVYLIFLLDSHPVKMYMCEMRFMFIDVSLGQSRFVNFLSGTAGLSMFDTACDHFFKQIL